MRFYQKKNKNQITLEIGESGIVYTLKDESVNRTEKVPFEDILNDKYEIYESNKAFKNNAIYGGVVGAIFLTINLVYGTSLWAWLFLVSCPTFYYLYHRSKAAFTVIKTASAINMVVLQDKQHQYILEEVYKSRNSYLKANYLGIDYDNDPKTELSKFAWLKEQGIISDREFLVIQEEIESNLAE